MTRPKYEYENMQKPAAQHVDQSHSSTAAPKSAGGAHATGGDAAQPTTEGNATEDKKTSKPASTARTQSAAPKSVGAAHPEVTAGSAEIMNPSYVDASNYVEKFFRRQGEIASLLDLAARGGFEAFRIRTSADYNKSSSLAMVLFEVALSALPAASGLLNVFKELTSGKKRTALLMKIIDTGGDAIRADDMIKSLHKAAEHGESAAKVSEEVKLAKEGIEKVKAPHETKEARSTAQEKGNFETGAITALTDLAAESMRSRFNNEDAIVAMLELLENTAPTTKLKDLVTGALGPMPEAASTSDVTKVSENFEVQLYVDWYVTSGKASRTIISRRGRVVSDEFGGIPEAVVERFRILKQMDILLKLPPVEVDDTQWTGHMQ